MTSEAVDAAADRAKAAGLVLMAADYPSGWKVETHPSDPSERDTDRRFAACVGLPDPDSVQTVDVPGPDATTGEFVQAGSDATFYRQATQARDQVAAADSPKFLPCAKQEITRLLQDQQLTVQSVDVERLAVQRYGEAAAGLRAIAKVTANGTSTTIYYDSVQMVKGRLTLGVTFSNVGQPFDPALERSLIAKAGAKIEAA